MIDKNQNITNPIELVRFATKETVKEFFHPLKVFFRLLNAQHLSRITKAALTGVLPNEIDPRISKYGPLFPIVHKLSDLVRAEIEKNKKLNHEIEALNKRVFELESELKKMTHELSNVGYEKMRSGELIASSREEKIKSYKAEILDKIKVREEIDSKYPPEILYKKIVTNVG